MGEFFDLHIFLCVPEWYYGTYKEPIMSVGESGEKLWSYSLNKDCFHGLAAMIW